MRTICIGLLMAVILGCGSARAAAGQETMSADARLAAQGKTATTPVGAQPTAREVIEAIKKEVGIPWMAETVDTFKAGDPETRVTGIAVTMMATMDVLQRAVAKGDNLIITHEPTFYNHIDRPEGIAESDAVWKDKRDYIAAHGLVVWRFHDHWHIRNPDGILTGMVKTVGWQKYQTAENPHLFVLPETSLKALAADVAKKLDSPVLRVVGDPQMKVTRIAFNPGAGGPVKEMKLLERDDVEVLLVGETREWETVEYAADAVSEGKRKALIVIGHIPSEQAGMGECAEWLRGFVKGTRVDFVEAKQPFWMVRR
jgi:putative NIF3 family GTP cyclohydrolase 1 type 2